MKQTLLTLTALLLAPLTAVCAVDSLTPYTAETVPDNVVDLWKDFDPRKEPLETEIVKEWKEDGIVCRYVIFKVGRFNGADSRIAAYYTFPEGAKSVPGIVWAHGGGQRAEKERGVFLAKFGYASIDINWGGRPLEDAIEQNTDWGNVDPTQGPMFYGKALRKSVYRKFDPDPYTVDPVVSPRNDHWFLLALAGRRGITFLEQQPEVDPERIGFTGLSKGGVITSMAAIDKRLKAVVPMVGGSGFDRFDFQELPDSGGRGRPDVYDTTIDPMAYWPHVTCPVMFLSASDDFNAPFDNIYKSMALLSDQGSWRVSQSMHLSHVLGSEQYILINLWFAKYLKGEAIIIPKTAESSLVIKATENAAVFTVQPDQAAQIKALDIYYSYDPNPRARFWKRATDVKNKDGVWTTTFEVRPGLPLFVFANCTYPLDRERESFGGATSTFTITSTEQKHLPEQWKLETLRDRAESTEVFSTFGGDWGVTRSGGLQTYKFQDPDMKIPANDRTLRLKLKDVKEKLSVRFRVTKNKFLTGVKEPKEDFVASVLLQPGDTEVIVGAADFHGSKKQEMTDWNNISTLTLEFIQQGKSMHLKGNPMLQSLEWTVAKPSP